MFVPNCFVLEDMENGKKTRCKSVTFRLTADSNTLRSQITLSLVLMTN